jgi:DNA-binding Xre family transcriptional regulator
METTNYPTFLDQILGKLRPVDLHIKENRLVIKARVEHLLTETGLTKAEMGSRIRREMVTLRSWLSGTRNLTVETLQELCAALHISLGDLVLG